MDSPSAQLRRELETASSTGKPRRPLLTHLNADTSWLVQFPIPIRGSFRTYYNVLIDPWFQGPQIDVGSWFSEQWHNTETNITTIRDVEQVIERNEAAANSGIISQQQPSNGDNVGECMIDVVFISHEFRDHCHHDTLMEVNKRVPVFATEKAAKLIASWSHFDVVKEITAFTGNDTDWRHTSAYPLPSWLGISRLIPKWLDLISFHSAIMLTFNIKNIKGVVEENSSGGVEAIVYTPHGIVPEDMKHLPAAYPPIETLALIHGLNDVKIGSQLNLGAHNGLKAVRLLKARYWVRTHDEMKTAYGLVGYFLKYKPVTFDDALGREKQEKGHGSDELGMEGVRFADLGIGDTLMLE